MSLGSDNFVRRLEIQLKSDGGDSWLAEVQLIGQDFLGTQSGAVPGSRLGANIATPRRWADASVVRAWRYEGFVKLTTEGYRWTRKVTLIKSELDKPRHWKKPRIIFVNSMADMFHEAHPLEDIKRVFEVMVACPQHQFQILTKRSARLAELAPHLPWPSNVWMGVSIESQEYAFRADHLRQVPTATRFISAEPLLGPLTLNLDNIAWLICGGESGHGARPMDLDWARSLRDQCIKANTSFFLKQLGGRHGKRNGLEAVLDGRRWTEMPNGVVLSTKAA